MSDDIFADWKIKRFAVAENSLFGDSLSQGQMLVILTQIQFWAEYEKDLDQWCVENHAERQGMTVLLPDEKTLTLFSLRWL